MTKPLLRVEYKDTIAPKVTISSTRFDVKVPTGTDAQEVYHILNWANDIFDQTWEEEMRTYRERLWP